MKSIKSTRQASHRKTMHSVHCTRQEFFAISFWTAAKSQMARSAVAATDSAATSCSHKSLGQWMWLPHCGLAHCQKERERVGGRSNYGA